MFGTLPGVVKENLARVMKMMFRGTEKTPHVGSRLPKHSPVEGIQRHHPGACREAAAAQLLQVCHQTHTATSPSGPVALPILSSLPGNSHLVTDGLARSVSSSTVSGNLPAGPEATKGLKQQCSLVAPRTTRSDLVGGLHLFCTDYKLIKAREEEAWSTSPHSLPTQQ